MLDDVALQRENADRFRLPRGAPNCRASRAVRFGNCRDVEAGHRLRRPSERHASSTTAGSLKCVVASTIACAKRLGSFDLKMPLPTKMPSAPSCIINAASAGVETPPAQNSTTGSFPFCAQRRHEFERRAEIARARDEFFLRRDAQVAIASLIARMCRTASTMLPLPASPLLRIIAAPSAIRRSASPRSRAPQTNGVVKACLST